MNTTPQNGNQNKKISKLQRPGIVDKTFWFNGYVTRDEYQSFQAEVAAKRRQEWQAAGGRVIATGFHGGLSVRDIPGCNPDAGIMSINVHTNDAFGGTWVVWGMDGPEEWFRKARDAVEFVAALPHCFQDKK
jgi:hypothetical protein